MDSAEIQAPVAWQPITPKGVANFARASLARLLLVQLVFALSAAGAVTWFIATDWLPVLEQGINALPEEGSISSGQLYWQGPDPSSLGENGFLAITADTLHDGTIRSPAHLQVELGQRTWRVISLLGHLDLPYPSGYTMPFNRVELKPLWGAWRPALLVGVALVGTFALLIVWVLMATLYTGPAVMIGFYTNRDLSTTGAWRLAGAALMPGCLVMIAGIVTYGLGWLEIVQLVAIVAAHFLVGWTYVVLAPLALPRLPKAQRRGNPFSSGRGAQDSAALAVAVPGATSREDQAEH